jgi:hypothetical protein
MVTKDGVSGAIASVDLILSRKQNINTTLKKVCRRHDDLMHSIPQVHGLGDKCK